MSGVQLSIITPAYNETKSLPLLHRALHRVLDGMGVDWEWIVVDDHSADQTFAVTEELSRLNSRVRGVRMARNVGSHRAICCGLSLARGACGVIMAADLQDPPETIPALLEAWKAGSQVVWAVRQKREGESMSTVAFARLYYWIMRNVVGTKELAPEGADFLLMDRRVIDALNRFGESNISLFPLISWMGFRQSSIYYVKQARVHGSSGWTISKKIKLVVDSVASFSYLPIRAMSILGICCALSGFLYAGLVIFNYICGRPLAGWSSLMVVVLLIGGMLMLMMGVLGEYMWRSLDESRRRPRFLIEACTTLDANEHGRLFQTGDASQVRDLLFEEEFIS